MDLDFLNSHPETQLDWFSILTQLDNQVDHDHQLLPPPLPPPTTTQPIFNYSSLMHTHTTNVGFIKPASVKEEMKEMVFRMAALQPVQIDPEAVKPPKRRNVKVSKDPQSVAARLRRERISERIRILQRLVPGGTKMDTASMLDEAVQYMKFLKTQVSLASSSSSTSSSSSSSVAAHGISNSGIGRQRKVNTSADGVMQQSYLMR